MRLATQPLREFSHNSRGKIRIEFFITHLVLSSAGTALAPLPPGSRVKERKYDHATFRRLAAPCLGLFPSTGLEISRPLLPLARSGCFFRRIS